MQVRRHARQVFAELVKHSKNGNVKARKYAREIIAENAASPELRAFILAGMSGECEDLEFLNGCLEAAHAIIEHIVCNQEYVERRRSSPDADARNEADWEFIASIFRKIEEMGFSTEAIVKQVLCVFALMLSLQECSSLAEGIVAMISKYVTSFHKRFNRELRDCIVSAKKAGHRLSKEMATLLRLKNRSGPGKDIQIIKNRE